MPAIGRDRRSAGAAPRRAGIRNLDKGHAIVEPDDKTIGALYESLKGGLYNPRNHALMHLGQLKRDIGEGDGAPLRVQGPYQVERARVVLTRLKEDFEKVIAPR